jgi:hypothetical protein
MPKEVTSCDFHNLKQGSMTLQEYLQSLIKLHARGPDVTDQSIIDSVVKGISLGPWGEYLSRCRPKTVTKLFEIMQEYCISDRSKRQKLEERMSRGSHGTVRGHTRSHGTPTSRDSRKLSILSPKRSHGKPSITRAGVVEIIAMIDLAAKTVLAVMTGLAAKTDTIAKTVTRKAEEKRGAEEKKHHFVTSMAKIKAIGPMNAPSP